MQIRISDLMDDCCPAQVELRGGDGALAERIDARVREKITAPGRRRRAKLSKALPLAAALVLMLGTAAYAVSSFSMSAEPRSAEATPLVGRWLVYGTEGEVLQDRKTVFTGAGMVFSFTGPEERYHAPEFRCFYLPAEASHGFTDEEGWTRYLAKEHGEAETDIPYILQAFAVEPGVTRLTLSGEPTVVKDEVWGDWRVLEISSDYSEAVPPRYAQANYILLFDEQRGYLVEVKGTLDMDTLEHIARELEIRESDTPAESTGYTEMLGSIDVGRG